MFWHVIGVAKCSWIDEREQRSSRKSTGTTGMDLQPVCGFVCSEEGDDAETLARIKIDNNLGSAQKIPHNAIPRREDSKKLELGI
ncbi:hypothetical protein RB195_015847 [Necator americanus]|uniref:Uncharacterized protein n=1 Tax=Necator americanus TaxID=51031 RepID=A0ABR1E6G1_NECAM